MALPHLAMFSWLWHVCALWPHPDRLRVGDESHPGRMYTVPDVAYWRQAHM